MPRSRPPLRSLHRPPTLSPVLWPAAFPAVLIGVLLGALTGLSIPSFGWAEEPEEPAAAAESGVTRRLGPAQLVERFAPAVVTVEFVAQVEASGGLGALLGGEEEFLTEATCIFVDPRGIVLCSNTQLEGYTRLMQRFLGPAGRGMRLTVRPVGLTVLAGPGERLEARLLATDSDLDLAWLEIADPGDRTFPFIDLAESAEPRLGDSLYLLQRLEEHFDRAPVCLEGSIGGITELPRRLYVPTVQLETAFGLPVFAADGRPIGVTVLQLPDSDTLPETGGTLSQMRQTTRLRSLARAMVLPAATIVQATERVLAADTDPPDPPPAPAEESP